MNSREEIISGNDFFQDKQDLARQLIESEKKGHGYLPNSPSYKISPIFEINNKHLNIGRIENYYYLCIETPGNSKKHMLFENESQCKEFFTKFDDLSDNQLAFWLNQIESLA